MVTNRRIVDDSGPDFYPTPGWGTIGLLQHVRFVGSITEPCCGDGAMAEPLKAAGYSVHASDKFDRGYGAVSDFLCLSGPFDNVVTNPPFKIAEELLHHALERTRGKVCFLLRTAFLESITRYNTIYSCKPPARVLVFSERLSMYPKGATVEGGGTTSYSWFVWDNTYTGKQCGIEWIAPGLKRAA